MLAGVTVERIRLGLERARDAGLTWFEARRPWNPRVEVMFPVDYRPSSPCPHEGPIARVRQAYCCVCDASGLDHEPGMQVDPKTAPRPEPKVPHLGEPTLTRSQRRKLLALLTADQQKEAKQAELDARRFKRARASAERKSDNSGR